MTKKAIGSAEFKELTLDQQLRLIHRDGVYVGKRSEGSQRIVLFQLSGFYVEVFYKQYRREIDHLVITDNPDIIHPYMNQIQVRDLNKDPNKDLDKDPE